MKNILKKMTIGVGLMMTASCFMLQATSINAQERPNNMYGMHLAGIADQDLADVASLVNSNGGDWGYVTIVIQENDRDKNKWQTIFDKLRRHHLIPIVRLATRPEGPVWKRPNKEDAQGWVDFLNSLNWVVKDRYVILFNEPNHGQEWGGSVSPQTYAEIADEFAQKFKQKNSDFKIMLAGFDASAPHAAPNYYDEEVFLREVIQTKPHIFDNIDAWSSHAYPNPAFSGSPYARGRISIYGYEWEMGLLSRLGVTKELPIFITETGWVHSEGTSRTRNLSVDQVAENYKIYFSQITQDKRIKAVTPFVLDYQGDPFSHFSWKKMNSPDFYPQYHAVKSLPKEKGDPEQIIKINATAELPRFLLQDSNYKVRLYLRNKGQAILDGSSGYRIGIASSSARIESSFSNLRSVEPNAMTIIDFRMKTNVASGSQQLAIALFKDQTKQLDLFNWKFEVKPKPNINFKTVLFPKLKAEDSNYEIQIFNEQEELVFKKGKILVQNNKGAVLGTSNVALDEKYRIVILKPYYLPRQKIVTLKEGENNTNFEIMWPVDFNQDGKFSVDDIGKLAQKPSLLKLWLP
ncbi:MAG TPA: hypothetical protein VK338_01700 [Candidatus Nitrosocosmicus sp.]|nr:hypothetical protein [Candidatus Nitrosocosmicus sp.]